MANTHLGGALSDEPKQALVFDPLPEAPKPNWVTSKSPEQRAVQEAARQEAIQRDIPPLVNRIRITPGFESVPEEAIQHLAHRWAITITDGWEQGVQQCLDDIARQRLSAPSSGLFAHEAVAMEPGAFAGGR